MTLATRYLQPRYIQVALTAAQHTHCRACYDCQRLLEMAHEYTRDIDMINRFLGTIRQCVRQCAREEQ